MITEIRNLCTKTRFLHNRSANIALAVDAFGSWQGFDGWAGSSALQSACCVAACASQSASLSGGAIWCGHAGIDLTGALVERAGACFLACGLAAVNVGRGLQSGTNVALAVDALGGWQGLDGWAGCCALQGACCVTACAS